MLRAAAVLAVVKLADAHGSMSQPRSRQQHGLNIDGSNCASPQRFAPAQRAALRDGRAAMGFAIAMLLALVWLIISRPVRRRQHEIRQLGRVHRRLHGRGLRVVQR